ncbi:hypothetical protein JBKA6_0342 [Ichthyobacterium seriolicida]|uniref:Uncharacterized protein n=1 Tax=Ichthyobacterium seriolicida TaxID=242600 RepID=A0A1J1E8V7_9FLAO|nr:hypothetical protein JBKA6_0342 [Ichthyobacterium seriolicida]
MGHLGLTPQSIYKLGTYKGEGKRIRGSQTAHRRCKRTLESWMFCNSFRKNSIGTGKKE